LKYQVGDIIVFKRSDFLACVLANVLWLFDLIFLRRRWDKWGWHTAIISRVESDTIWILEALPPRSKERVLNVDEEFRCYRWLESPVSISRFNRAIANYVNKPYDFDSYIGTFITYPLTHIFHKPIRFVDDEYHCQELVCGVLDDYGEQLLENWQPIVITEMMAKLKGHMI